MAPIRYRLQSWARQRWRTACALSLAIAVASGGALLLLAGAMRTVTAPNRYSASRGDLYDVSIQQSEGAPRTAELEALPATGRVDAATFVFGGVIPPGGDAPADALVFSGEQAPLGTLLVEGREPNPNRPGEFVATRSLVKAVHSHVGARFRLITLTGEQAQRFGFNAPQPAGPSLTATLVGVIDGPSDLEDGNAVALFPRSLLDQGDVGVAATIAVASLRKGATSADLRNQLDALPNGVSFSVSPAMWVSNEVRSAVNAQGQALLIVGGIAALATIAVLGQLLSRQLHVDYLERNALLSVGFTPRQVVLEPGSRAALPAIVGAVSGTVLAYLFSDLFPTGFVRRIEPDPGRRFDPLVLGIGPTVIAVVLVLWVLVTVVLESRASTRQQQPSTFTERLAAAMPGANVSTAVRFAFARADVETRAARTSLVWLMLVFCVLFGALTFGLNLHRLVESPARYGMNFDVGVGSGEDQISDEVRQKLDSSADVAGLTLYGTTSATVGTDSVAVVGMQPVRGGLLPEVLEGRLPEGNDEVALGTIAARNLHAKIGSTLLVNGASGRRRLRVSGLALVPSVGGADLIGESVLVTSGGFLALDSSATMNTAAVRLAGDVSPGARQRIGRRIGFPVGPLDRPSAIVNLQRVRSMPYVVAATVGLLALLSLGHLMIVSVRRRRMDHAILRAIGASPRWLGGVVHWQATITTMVVVAVAIPLGTALGNTVYRQFVDHVGARTDALIPVLWLAAALGVVLVLANVVTAVPARKSRHDTPTRLLTGA